MILKCLSLCDKDSFPIIEQNEATVITTTPWPDNERKDCKEYYLFLTFLASHTGVFNVLPEWSTIISAETRHWTSSFQSRSSHSSEPSTNTVTKLLKNTSPCTNLPDWKMKCNWESTLKRWCSYPNRTESSFGICVLSVGIYCIPSRNGPVPYWLKQTYRVPDHCLHLGTGTILSGESK